MYKLIHRRDKDDRLKRWRRQTEERKTTDWRDEDDRHKSSLIWDVEQTFGCALTCCQWNWMNESCYSEPESVLIHAAVGMCVLLFFFSRLFIWCLNLIWNKCDWMFDCWPLMKLKSSGLKTHTHTDCYMIQIINSQDYCSAVTLEQLRVNALLKGCSISLSLSISIYVWKKFCIIQFKILDSSLRGESKEAGIFANTNTY